MKTEYKQTCAQILQSPFESGNLGASGGKMYYSTKRLMFCKMDSAENKSPEVDLATKVDQMSRFTLVLHSSSGATSMTLVGFKYSDESNEWITE